MFLPHINTTQKSGFLNLSSAVGQAVWALAGHSPAGVQQVGQAGTLVVSSWAAVGAPRPTAWQPLLLLQLRGNSRKVVQ